MSSPVMAKLSDVAEINPRAPERLENELVPFIPMADVSAESTTVTPRELRKLKDLNGGLTYFQADDVLVAKITPCFENGKVAQVRMSEEYGFGSTEFHVLRSDSSRLDSRYLLHYLRQERIRAEGERRMTGSAGQRRVPLHFLQELGIPLLSLSDQRRIAAILDKAEALRSARALAISKLQVLSESIFIEMFGNPHSGNNRWRKGVLGDFATFVGGGTPSRAREDYFTGSICWATSKDTKGEFLDDTEEHVTKEAMENSATKLVPKGAILMVVKSKILAHHLPVAIARVPTCFGQDLKAILPSEECETVFIATALRLGKRWLIERARGINTEGLTLDHLRAFPVCIPPLPLQRQFTRRTATAETLKSAYHASFAKSDALFATLQHRAFRGEL